MLKTSTVAILPVSGDVQTTVSRTMELANWRQFIKKGEPTSLKVNLGWDLFIPGSVTSPWVIEGVIKTIREWVGDLYLVEADQVLEDIEKAFYKLKLDQLCERYDVRWVNMSNLRTVKVAVPDGVIFKELSIPVILSETQLITIPVAKTHAKTQLSGAIKNQWGCISKLRHNYHLVLDDALAEINSVCRPVFAVMDATVGLEGNGPKTGKPKVLNRILASDDIVALDTVQARLMGLDPLSVKHVQRCAERKLGSSAISEIVMADPEQAFHAFDFQPAKHNLVSRVEELLRRSKFQKLVFHSPLFLLMLWGAKLWYRLWWLIGPAKDHWRSVLDHPIYGKEWQFVRSKSE